MKICIIRYGIKELKKMGGSFKESEEYKIEQALKKRRIEFDLWVTPYRTYTIDKDFINKTFGKYNVIFVRDKRHYRTVGILEVINDLLDVPVPIINSAEVASNCWDKLVTTKLLEKENIPHPKTVIGNDNVYVSLKAIEKEFNYPVVIKTSIGSHGNNVFIVDNYEQAKTVLTKLSRGNFYKREFYIQEYIKADGKDIRCLVIGDKVVAQYMRTAVKPERRSNIHLGGKGIKYELNKDLEKIALRASNVVGGGILGVDIFETKDGYKANEINETPELNELLRINKKDEKKIINKIIDYLLENAI